MLLWTVIGLATVVLVVGIFILIATGFWCIYRIVKGWLRLSEGQAMYTKTG